MFRKKARNRPPGSRSGDTRRRQGLRACEQEGKVRSRSGFTEDIELVYVLVAALSWAACT